MRYKLQMWLATRETESDGVPTECGFTTLPTVIGLNARSINIFYGMGAQASRCRRTAKRVEVDVRRGEGG